VASIELLAEIGNQAAKLAEDEIDRLSIFLVETLDISGHLYRRVFHFLSQCDWRHIEAQGDDDQA